MAITEIIPQCFEVPISPGTMAVTSPTSDSSQEQALKISPEHCIKHKARKTSVSILGVEVCSCWEESESLLAFTSEAGSCAGFAQDEIFTREAFAV